MCADVKLLEQSELFSVLGSTLRSSLATADFNIGHRKCHVCLPVCKPSWICQRIRQVGIERKTIIDNRILEIMHIDEYLCVCECVNLPHPPFN